MALALAYRDPRTPWYGKVWTALVVAYAISPIDLIPDFIPVLGYLDDLVLIPLGIWVAMRLIPAEVMADARRDAAQHEPGTGRWIGALLVVVLWVILLVVLGRAILQSTGVA